MSDLTEQEVLDLGYALARDLPNGEWLAVRRMFYTTGLFIVTDRCRWRTRYCYEHPIEALNACLIWDGKGDPPGLWIKQKPEERLNPKWLAVARREVHGNPRENARREAGDG